MRLVAAIIAAVMSVATGGPLRCPCQLAALLRDTPCTDQSASAVRTLPTTPPSALHSGCGCKTHTTDDEQPPAEHQPDRPEPCNHGPGIDLVAPSTVERQAGDSELGNPLSVPSGGAAASPCRVPDTSFVSSAEIDSSPPARLRYCHSFRC